MPTIDAGVERLLEALELMGDESTIAGYRLDVAPKVGLVLAPQVNVETELNRSAGNSDWGGQANANRRLRCCWRSGRRCLCCWGLSGGRLRCCWCSGRRCLSGWCLCCWGLGGWWSSAWSLGVRCSLSPCGRRLVIDYRRADFWSSWKIWRCRGANRFASWGAARGRK